MCKTNKIRAAKSLKWNIVTDNNALLFLTKYTENKDVCDLHSPRTSSKSLLILSTHHLSWKFATLSKIVKFYAIIWGSNHGLHLYIAFRDLKVLYAAFTMHSLSASRELGMNSCTIYIIYLLSTCIKLFVYIFTEESLFTLHSSGFLIQMKFM